MISHSICLSDLFSIVPSKSIHIAANAAFHFLWLSGISLNICTITSLFSCWWTLRLLPYLSTYKSGYCENWGACIFSILHYFNRNPELAHINVKLVKSLWSLKLESYLRFFSLIIVRFLKVPTLYLIVWVYCLSPSCILLYLPGMQCIFVAGDADSRTVVDRITNY